VVLDAAGKVLSYAIERAQALPRNINKSRRL